MDRWKWVETNAIINWLADIIFLPNKKTFQDIRSLERNFFWPNAIWIMNEYVMLWAINNVWIRRMANPTLSSQFKYIYICVCIYTQNHRVLFNKCERKRFSVTWSQLHTTPMTVESTNKRARVLFLPSFFSFFLSLFLSWKYTDQCWL